MRVCTARFSCSVSHHHPEHHLQHVWHRVGACSPSVLCGRLRPFRPVLPAQCLSVRSRGGGFGGLCKRLGFEDNEAARAFVLSAVACRIQRPLLCDVPMVPGGPAGTCVAMEKRLPPQRAANLDGMQQLRTKLTASAKRAADERVDLDGIPAAAQFCASAAVAASNKRPREADISTPEGLSAAHARF